MIHILNILNLSSIFHYYFETVVCLPSVPIQAGCPVKKRVYSVEFVADFLDPPCVLFNCFQKISTYKLTFKLNYQYLINIMLIKIAELTFYFDYISEFIVFVYFICLLKQKKN